MKHLTTITQEFVKSAWSVPLWWKELSLKQQQEYKRTHPGTRLPYIYKRNEVNGVTVHRVDPKHAIDSSFVSYMKGPTKKDIVRVFGRPNAHTDKYGDEWVVRIGNVSATIYGQHGDDKNEWHIGGQPTIKEYIESNFKTVFPNTSFME
jgi:hypothetical protein